MTLVERILPKNTDAELEQALLEAQQYLFSFGITAWQDAWVTGDVHETYRRLAADGWLRAHVRGALWWERNEGIDQLDAMEERRRESVSGYNAGSGETHARRCVRKPHGWRA